MPENISNEHRYSFGPEDSFSDIEKAFEDTVVLSAAKEAKLSADFINRTNNMNEEFIVQKKLKELNAMVAHVHGATVLISGYIQQHGDDEKNPFQYVSETYASFGGFIQSMRNGLLSYDYNFTVVVDDNGVILEKERIDEDARNGEEPSQTVVYAQALTDGVFLNFSKLQPVRARALLDLSYPDTMRLLDDLILYEGKGDDANALFALRAFSHTVHKGPVETHEYTKLQMNAINTYANGMVKLDTEVPYFMNVDGYALTLPEDDPSRKITLHANNVLFSAAELFLFSPDLDKEKAENVFTFGLRGMLHSRDYEKPGKFILLPLQSVTSLQSMRGTVPSPTPNTSVSE